MKAIIIDDEPDCVSILALQLEVHCPQVEVMGEFTSGKNALDSLKNIKPDLVFLDIEMPGMNGFQFLEAASGFDFAVIFVTAYDKFAVRAFRFSALDYLLKPTDPKDLIAAVEKAERSKVFSGQQLEMLRQQLSPGIQPYPEKIALPHANGVTFVELKNIAFCKADDNYTYFHLLNGQKYLVSKTLRTIQETLPERTFLRVHRQYLVNLDHAVSFTKSDGCNLVMANGIAIPVARSQKDRLIERFGWV